DPFWSQDGKYLAFTGFQTASVGLYNNLGTNGDEKAGGQIWLATADDMTIHDDAKVLVARTGGATIFYPAISNDDKLVVFNVSGCTGSTDLNKGNQDYGNGSCDGYDDWSATLWLTTIDGGGTIRLDNANGLQPNQPGMNSNSWPRWSPDNG